MSSDFIRCMRQTKMSSSKEFDKIQQLLGKLRQEADYCISRINELEKELLQTSPQAPSMLNHIVNANTKVITKHITCLLKAIGYQQGDTLRISIKKLEKYIIDNNLINYKNFNVVPNKLLANAFEVKEGGEISYEGLLGRIPTIFK